ncbi:MAG: radical SAM/SPASM domain-containing protein [Acidobacteriota bacterium]
MGWDHLTAEDRRSILRGIEAGEAPGGPLHAEIHPTDRCQAACTFCSTDDWREDAGLQHMDIEVFHRVVAELAALGTKSVRVAGGGEPLHHPRIAEMLGHLHESGIAVENLTTNGIQLTAEISALLVHIRADRITVSINSGSARTYAAMMRTAESAYARVLENTRTLTATKRAARSSRPLVIVQYLVHRGNFEEIPAMYRLARELRVDKIVFDGLAYLDPAERMDEAETEAMMGLYRQVVQEDGFYRIARITSHEQPVERNMWRIVQGLGRWPVWRRKLERLGELLLCRDRLAIDKLRMIARSLRKEAAPRPDAFERPCFVGYYSPTIRATGRIAMCCTVQDRFMGHVDEGIGATWNSAGYRSLRRQLRRIMSEGQRWTYRPDQEGHVVPMCAGSGFAGCRTRDFFYQEDIPFVRKLNGLLKSMRA